MARSTHPILQAAIGREQVFHGSVVQRFSLDEAARLVPDPGALLTEEEAARARRLLSPLLQRRAAASRAILHAIVSDLTGRDPADVAFEIGPHGKPALVGGGLRFSVSHSDDRLAVAWSFTHELGVDVELPSLDRNVDAAAGFALNPDELAALDGLRSDRRKLGFLRLWTAKEAALKGLGVGFHRPMREVAIDPAGLAALGEAGAWRPRSATIDGASIEIVDASTEGDVACLAVLPQDGGANSLG